MAKGYIIARVRIDDLDQYKKYMAVSPDAIGAFDGKFVVRGGPHETAEGEEETRRLVVVEFPSFEAAKECYYSDVYQEAKKLRDGAGEAQFVLVEGV
ncbi:MAG: DUF1330 domain-containing protein [Pseudomonadota bacterium]